METKTTIERRFTARCLTCKRAHSLLAPIAYFRWQGRGDMYSKLTRESFVDADGRTIGAPAWREAGFVCCGRRWSYLQVKGVLRTDVKCNAKCTGSTGHVCECSCGGKNHGAGHG